MINNVLINYGIVPIFIQILDGYVVNYIPYEFIKVISYITANFNSPKMITLFWALQFFAHLDYFIENKP